ncbi:hypothetical protein PRK78_007337, partial [Emydomyces testavorans]
TRLPQEGISYLEKDILVAIARSPRRKSLVTVVACPVTSRVIALREPIPESPELKSATNVVKWDTLLGTATRALGTIPATAVARMVVMAVVLRPATLVVDMVTWLVTALKDRNAITAVKLATSLATVPLRARANVFVTNANSPATSKPPVPTRLRIRP